MALWGREVPVPKPIRVALKEIVGEPVASAVDCVRVIEHSVFARLHVRATATTRRGLIFLHAGAEEFFAESHATSARPG